ncbi:MAG: ABC transporter permease [Proteobacteria bacterium]|nr:ABC transporter permease [Pseudomonadota bacterium]
MLRNYLAAALRNLARNRLYAAINIIGLAVGFAATMLIALFVRDELTYDRWIPGHESIYRVSGYTAVAEIKQAQDALPREVAEALTQETPEIAALGQLSFTEHYSLRKGETEATEEIHFANSQFFALFPLPVIAGNLQTALAAPNSIVLTRRFARKYFGRDAPVGETIEVNRDVVLRVTAVLEDLPSNTHLDLSIVIPIEAMDAIVTETYRRDIMYAYVRLAPDVSPTRLLAALPAFNERHPAFTKARYPYWLDTVTPIADIHLRPDNAGSMKPSGSAATIANATAIAVLILTIASINFVNLTTARATRRSVEVGVRKVSGAARRQFIAQFIGEAVFYAALGMAAAVAMTALALRSFNGFLQRTVTLDFARDPILILLPTVIVLVAGAAAGAYPALVLSRFSPARVLKGEPRTRVGRSRGRHILVAAQFAALIALALVATAITRQARHTSTEALRLDTDQMLIVHEGPRGSGCAPEFATHVRGLAGVRAAACIMGPVLGGPSLLMDVSAPNGMSAKSQYIVIEPGSFELYGLRPIAGRFFSSVYGSDAPPLDGKIDLAQNAIINAALARGLGYANPQDAIGETIRFTATIARSATEKRPNAVTEVVGVVSDFGASRNLKESAPPRVFFIEPDTLQTSGALHVKLTGREIPETLAAIDELWKKLGPPQPIERYFLARDIEARYGQYARLGEMVATFAALAVFISCLGLFGLAAFAAEQRTKEIGVRKSMGASGADIVRLMLWDFSKPVLWGSLIAWPAGYLIMRRWLDNFADRIDIEFWMFPTASALALLIALLTVVGHALLVARAEPVKALRYE